MYPFNLTGLQIMLMIWALGFVLIWMLLLCGRRTRENLLQGTWVDLILKLYISAIPVINLVWSISILAMLVFSAGHSSVIEWLDRPVRKNKST